MLILLELPGEVITQEELRQQTWKDGTFVDVEHGLSAAINKLRRTLGDSAENPPYIETVPGRAYWFIGRNKQAAVHVGPVLPLARVAMPVTC